MENYKQIDSAVTLKQFSNSKITWHDKVINHHAELFSDENKPSRFLDKFCRIQEFRDSSDDHKNNALGHGTEHHQASNPTKKKRNFGSSPTNPVYDSTHTSRPALEDFLYLGSDPNETNRKQQSLNAGTKRKNLKITFRGSQREGSPGQKNNDNTNMSSHASKNNNNNNNEFYYHLKVDHDGKNLAHERRESLSQSMRTLHPYFHSEKVMKNFYVSSEVNLVRFFEKMNNTKNNITPHLYSEPLASKESISKSSK